MTDRNEEICLTEEEIKANSRADALAIFSIVVIVVGMVIFYVAS